MCEPIDRFVRVVHGERNSLPLKVVDVHLGRLASVCWGVDKLQLSWSGSDEIGGAVLVRQPIPMRASERDIPGLRKHDDQ
jgi:hypothetical protein